MLRFQAGDLPRYTGTTQVENAHVRQVRETAFELLVTLLTAAVRERVAAVGIEEFRDVLYCHEAYPLLQVSFGLLFRLAAFQAAYRPRLPATASRGRPTSCKSTVDAR